MRKDFLFIVLATVCSLSLFSCKQGNQCCQKDAAQCPKNAEKGIITLRARMEIKADSVDAFKEMAVELIRETRKEPGCLEYNLYQVAHQSNVFFFYEEFKDMDAIHHHNKQSYMKTFQDRRASMLVGKPSAQRYHSTPIK